ncbi:MAG TPA: ABC transporter permease [Candidatus Dormibacteraeota bacterium]|nr:ABC transporter permease [Candidatus Dormibacteraeota bacterium]
MFFLTDTWLVFQRYMGKSLSSLLYMGVSLAQPALYLVLFAPLLKSVAGVPGFPQGGAYNVFVPGLLVQLGLFGATSGGWALIAELRAGVIERLRVTPASRLALLLGRTLRDIVMLLLQAAIIVVASVPFGLALRLPGVLFAFVLMALIALLMATLSLAIALVLRDENTFGAIVFSSSLPLLLLSGVLLPMSLAPQWLQDVAAFNPLLYAVEAQRALFANQVVDPTVVRGFVAVGLLALGAVVVATRSFGRAVA